MMQLDDPSSSFIIPIEQPLPVLEPIAYMGSDLLKAAEDGDMKLFSKYQGGLHCLVDGRRNTALHIYSRTGGRQVGSPFVEKLVDMYLTMLLQGSLYFLVDRRRNTALYYSRTVGRQVDFSIKFVEKLVDKCPSLLLQQNARGEIPLHIAAKHGHSEIVKFLIERAKILQHEDLEKGTASEATSSRLKRMLRMGDKEENTVFHTAVASGNVDVVRLLVKELDPDFSFSANTMGETPLYIAAKGGHHRVVAEILDNCSSLDYGGPNGKTALHVAVMGRRNEMTVRKLIEAKKQLIKETDDKGRSALHYAVYFGISSMAKLLLESDASAAYITDKERGMSPLHLAAWQSNVGIMEDIVFHCPGCCEIVDNRGWNFLHIAVITLSAFKLNRFLLGYKNRIKDLPFRNLLDEKDINGNTPLQILNYSKAYDHKGVGYYASMNILSSLASDGSVYHINLNAKTKKKQILEVLKDIANNMEVAGKPVYDIHNRVKLMEEDIPRSRLMDNVRESHLLVATLVATVTFAAAFTVPGGYKSEKGTATLIHDLAFKAFVITDTLAFVSSLLAIFIHFYFLFFRKHVRRFLDFWIVGADALIFFAMIEMMVAFSTGTYAVLKSSLGFAIATCSLGFIFFCGLLSIGLYPFKSRFLHLDLLDFM